MVEFQRKFFVCEWYFPNLLNLNQYLDFKQLVALSLAIVATHKLHFMRCFQPRCGLLIKWNEEKHSLNINLKLEMLPYELLLLLKIFLAASLTKYDPRYKHFLYIDKFSCILIKDIYGFAKRIVVLTWYIAM